ncbi:MAG: glycosyl hydrolase [Opitutales bacterium]
MIVGLLRADSLVERFQSPFEDTKPWCYWYWIGGDITAEGIAKDLEDMAEIGISLAMIGNVDVNAKTNNGTGSFVEILSPEWRELKMHALREAKRVGVDIYFFNCPGWSQSGGPWIQPEQSMRRVIWSEFESSGGAFRQKVRAEGVPGGGSQDIAVLAVPQLSKVSIEAETVENQYIFSHSEPFTARSLLINGAVKGTLFAVRKGEREAVADIDVNAAFAKTDFLMKEPQTVSFPDVTAQRFELDFEPSVGRKKRKKLRAQGPVRVVISSEPKVAQVLNKQMGRMHPTPSPGWDSYVFKDSVEPKDLSVLIDSRQVINLSDKLNADGVLDCTLPNGAWRILYFGMVTTGKVNHPAAPEASGLEVDKMSREHTRHHFDSYVGSLYQQMTPEEKDAFKGITIDSYEVGSQNWTDGFASEFEKRNGYNPIPLLPILTGTVIDGAKQSDQFLWDLRRTVADMIAENYLGGLRDIADEHGLALWCEPYGHWGFPGDFTIYGGYADQVGGEFWSKGVLGDIECRATSSVAHTYGKHRTFAEAFTSQLNLEDNPYSFKARGERMFSDGINHFVLHVYLHQPRDGGMPGRNAHFGTAFHRNTPWFNESQSWIKYLQRCHTMLQWGNPANDVLVYIGDFAPQMTGPPNPVPEGYQYDYVGSDAILRKLDVVDGQWVTYDENDPQRIAARWEVMTIPNTLKYIRPQIQERIDELEKKGGRIIHSVPVTAEQLGALDINPAVSNTSCSILWIERKHDDQHLFFLSNFEQAGAFTADLRVQGMQPELFNPVTGEIKKLARFEETANGTRIEIDVKDPADSFFVMFREETTTPSVVDASASVSELDLYYNAKNELVVESAMAGNYTLTMSDGTERSVSIHENAASIAIENWNTETSDHEGFTNTHVAEFELRKNFAKDQRVILDLGKVEIMAEVTLNGKTFETLWMPPFTLDVTDALESGRNSIDVRITSTTEGQPALNGPVYLKTRNMKEMNL